MSFRAIVLRKDENKNFSAQLESITQDELLSQAEADTLIKVDYSTLNYKDTLAITNKGPVVRKWPMIPGIDCVGTVLQCKTGKLQEGQKIILNGWGVGETHWGGLAEYANLQSDWLIPLPNEITPWQSMAIGTAGYTAALCVLSIVEHGIRPDDGKILVSGATGGVGSIAVMLLSQMGYKVVATTGKNEEEAYLKNLGASQVISRDDFTQTGKPLQKELWAAAVDVAGSHTLANICAQTQYGGIVTACGLAQGMDFPSSVAPFILRNVTLAGIDSVMAETKKRIGAWNFLAKYLNLPLLDSVAQTIKLDDCFDITQKMMNGSIKGRFVVDLSL